MAGYKGWAMSNNAVAAYENGKKPLSKWTKAAILDAIRKQEIELKCSKEKLRKLPVEVLKETCLIYSSWHHTSSHYNKTDFYSLCAFLEWSGSKRHPKATELIEVGIVKGDWFYREDGSKKKTTANGFKFLERVEA